MIVKPCSPCGISHVDWDTTNIIVDKNDYTRIVAILDWDFSQVRPTWNISFDLRSLYTGITLDTSRHNFYEEIRQKCITENAPHAKSLLDQYYHYCALSGAARYPGYASEKSVMFEVMSLMNTWPKGAVGYVLIEEFVTSWSNV